MVIGITGNKKEGKLKLSKFLSENYSFQYVDVDEIFDEIFKKNSKLLKTTKTIGKVRVHCS